MVIGKFKDVFKGIFFGSGVGEKLKEVTWEDLPMEEFVTGEKNFNERGLGFASTIKKIMKNNMKSFFNWK